MILEVSPESSVLVRGAAAALLYLHVGCGAIGIASGAGALVLRKGSQFHRVAGNVFVVSMLVMAAIGAGVSPFLPTPSWLNVVGGILTLYMVVTAWMTVKRDHVIGRFEVGSFMAACLVVASAASVGVYVATHPTDDSSQGPVPVLMFGIVATLAAIGDFRLMRRKSLTGTQRLVRHLWRMCYALFVAVGSLFLGQPQIFPDAVRGTGVLFIPVLAVLITMMFWLVRVRFAKRGLHLAAATR